METMDTSRTDTGTRTLETSLVEWKHSLLIQLLGLLLTLETSLVEWKPADHVRYRVLEYPWKLP